MAERPNVLFVLSDQHNAKVVGYAGHPDVFTPNLDRLAAEGVRFDNAIVQNPICTPSRMCYISGQYCHNHGYYGLSGPNPGSLPTLLGHFRRAGYRTGAIGKIHCPEYWVEDDSDVFLEVSVSGRNDRSEYASYLRERGTLDDYLQDVKLLHSRRGAFEGFAARQTYRDSRDGWAAARGIDFMRDTAERGQPFFLHVSLQKPHSVYAPAREFWDLYDEDELTLPPNADYEMTDKSPHMRRMAERFRQGDWTLYEPRTFEAGRLRKLHGYLGCVTHMDHAVGELLDWLRESGLEEDTIVVYGSDHGDYAIEHGLMEKAPGICSDAITRVPFVWRWPGRIAAGHTVEGIVETVDMSTTLCSLAGLEPMVTSDGNDLSHLLRGGSEPVKQLGVTEFAWSKSVRKGRYRYVHYPPEMFPEEYPDGFGELYDLEADPWEMENLYFEPEHQGVVQELRADLLNWLLTTTRVRTMQRIQVKGRWTGTRYKQTYEPDGKFLPADWWEGGMRV
jgi:choline-sulfatase/uncharacterized sulfatase